MAKPLGEKSRIIRKAIIANPAKGNTGLAEMLNDSQDRLDDKISFTANDVAAQRIALKKLAEKEPEAPAPVEVPALPKKRGRPARPKAAANSAAPARTVSPADLIERLFELAEECGGLGQLKRLVDRVAEHPRA